MKTNKRIREDVYKMIFLGIPKSKIRKYLGGAYNFVGRLHRTPRELNSKLDFLIKNKITHEKAVSELEEMFSDIISDMSIEKDNPISRIHS